MKHITNYALKFKEKNVKKSQKPYNLSYHTLGCLGRSLELAF